MLYQLLYVPKFNYPKYIIQMLFKFQLYHSIINHYKFLHNGWAFLNKWFSSSIVNNWICICVYNNHLQYWIRLSGLWIWTAFVFLKVRVRFFLLCLLICRFCGALAFSENCFYHHQWPGLSFWLHLWQSLEPASRIPSLVKCSCLSAIPACHILAWHSFIGQFLLLVIKSKTFFINKERFWVDDSKGSLEI